VGKIIPSSGDHHQAKPFYMADIGDEDEDDKEMSESVGKGASFKKQPVVILDVVGKKIPSRGNHHKVHPFSGLVNTEEDEEDDDVQREALGSPHVSFKKDPAVILDVVGKVIPSSGDHHGNISSTNAKATEDVESRPNPKDLSGSGQVSFCEVSFNDIPAVILKIEGPIIPSSGDHHEVHPVAMVDDDEDELDVGSIDKDMLSEAGSLGHVSFSKQPPSFSMLWEKSSPRVAIIIKSIHLPWSMLMTMRTTTVTTTAATIPCPCRQDTCPLVSNQQSFWMMWGNYSFEWRPSSSQSIFHSRYG
jgi:hypothetical protein